MAHIQDSTQTTVLGTTTGQVISGTMPANFTAGSTAFVAIVAYPGNSITYSVVINGVTATLDAIDDRTAIDQTALFLYRAVGLPGGANTWSVTDPTGGSYLTASCVEFSDALTVSPIDQNPAQTNTTSPTSASITTGTLAQADELVIALVGNSFDGAGFAPPAGFAAWLNIQNYSGSSSGAAAWAIVSSTAAITATWGSPGSANWGSARIVTYKLSGGGGGGGGGGSNFNLFLRVDQEEDYFDEPQWDDSQLSFPFRFASTAPTPPDFIGIYDDDDEPEEYAKDEWEHDRKFLFVLAASSSQPPGISIELNSSFALQSSHIAIVGISTETSISLSVSSSHVANIGLSTETNSSLALSSQHLSQFGLSGESNASFSLGSAHVAQYSISSSSDSAFSLSASKVSLFGTSLETDISLSLASIHSFPPGISTELDLSMSPVGGASPGISIETNIALGLASVHTKQFGQSSETSNSFALSSSRVAVFGQSAEINSSLALQSTHSSIYGISTSAETAFSVLASRVSIPGISSEFDISFAPGTGSFPPGISVETNASVSLASSRVKQVGLSSETNLSFALQSSHVSVFGIANSINSAFSLNSSLVKAYGISNEIDISISSAIPLPPGIATELNSAISVLASHVSDYKYAGDTSSAFGLQTIHVAVPGIATEIDSAYAIKSGIVVLTGDISGYWVSIEIPTAYWI